MPDTTDENVKYLQVCTETTLVKVQANHVEMIADGYKAGRSVRQWLDLVKASVKPGKPFGTFVCPICGTETPHNHSESELEIETKARPAFELFMFTRLQELCKGKVHQFLKEGYWMSLPATEAARYDGGWAERRDGEYRYDRLQAAWLVWQSAWLAKTEQPHA